MSTLPASAEVVVIGGGVMGTSIAFHLAEAGVPGVLLLERGSLGGGSTSKSAGGVRVQFTDAVNVALGARSLEAFERFGTRPGADIDLRQVGYLFLHTEPEALAAAETAVSLQNSLGLQTQVLSAAEAGRLNPGLSMDGVLGATFHPRDGYCSPESVVAGYASGARAFGASVRARTAVTGIETSGGTITGVVTAEGTVRTSAVVCAAGAWSRQVSAWAGCELPVDPVRRQILVSEPLGPGLLALFHDRVPMTIDASSTFYLHREGPALLIGMSYRGERLGFQSGYGEEWMTDLLAAMTRRAPVLLDLGIAHRWSGYYEVTPDDNAVIGSASSVSRFLYATGFSGHGFLQGPAVGEIVRDLYLGHTPAIDVSAFSAERFSTGTRVLERAIV